LGGGQGSTIRHTIVFAQSPDEKKDEGPSLRRMKGKTRKSGWWGVYGPAASKQ